MGRRLIRNNKVPPRFYTEEEVDKLRKEIDKLREESFNLGVEQGYSRRQNESTINSSIARSLARQGGEWPRSAVIRYSYSFETDYFDQGSNYVRFRVTCAIVGRPEGTMQRKVELFIGREGVTANRERLIDDIVNRFGGDADTVSLKEFILDEFQKVGI